MLVSPMRACVCIHLLCTKLRTYVVYYIIGILNYTAHTNVRITTHTIHNVVNDVECNCLTKACLWASVIVEYNGTYTYVLDIHMYMYVCM